MLETLLGLGRTESRGDDPRAAGVGEAVDVKSRVMEERRELASQRALDESGSPGTATDPSSVIHQSTPPSPPLSRSTTPIHFHHPHSTPQKIFKRLKSLGHRVTPSRSSNSEKRKRSSTITANNSNHDGGRRRSESTIGPLREAVESEGDFGKGKGKTKSRAYQSTPSSPTFSSTPLSPLSAVTSPPPPSLTYERDAIKIRCVTFNMMDGLPNGDLTEFLGDLTSFNSNSAGQERMREGLKKYPIGGERGKAHPFHILVVAGQECPTASGVSSMKIPRALDGKGWTSILENTLCGGCFDSSDEEDDTSSVADNTFDEEEEEGKPGRMTEEPDELIPPPPIFRTISSAGSSRSSSRTGTSSSSQRQDFGFSHGGTSAKASEKKKKVKRVKGPYVLVEKERLLGIYLAVFVARECNDFVTGASKSRVTAGLLGGRLGNKGAVGISLHFHHSRFAFISAHLAAHASALDIRKANARKILGELELDDFKGSKSGGEMELTELFDQTFFMGDLNFRLDVSRLHADFILKTQDYTTALQFDQLRRVFAESDNPFQGMTEAPIKFAPTYKYDVPSRKSKRGLGRKFSRAPNPARPSTGNSSISTATNLEIKDHSPDDDAISITSSNSSGMSEYDHVDDEELASLDLTSSPKTRNGLDSEAVRKAQVKFLTLVKSNSTGLRRSSAASAKSTSGSSSPRKLLFSGNGGLNPPTNRSPRPILKSSLSDIGISGLGRSLSRMNSATSTGDSSGEEERRDIEEPVFDTSSKQRVQSYTDRILFKSTIEREVQPVPASLTRNLASTLVHSLKGFVHLPLTNSSSAAQQSNSNQTSAHHSYFDVRPTADNSSRRRSEDIQTSRTWSVEEPRHGFANFFGRHHQRRGLTSRSVESLNSPMAPTSNDETPRKGGKARSLFTPNRRISLGRATIRSDSPTSPVTPDSQTTPLPLPSITLPLQVTPVKLDRKPGRSFSASEAIRPFVPISPPESKRQRGVRNPSADDASPTFFQTNQTSHAGFPRSYTRTSVRTSGNQNPSSRLKSFFNFLPLPSFLSTTKTEDGRQIALPVLEMEKIGPRKGEIQALEYDAVKELMRMGAISDHRPVFLSVAIGIGESD